MNNDNARVLCLLLSTALASGALAGDLNPPAGPVAPTMKTLDEVEPRTPIHAADLPLLITAPGSYYLAEDIVTAGNGIAVNASDVTIDLMGFILEGGTGIGINFASQRRCVVRNGTVAGWGSTGINASVISEGVFEDLRVVNCGVNGLLAGANAQVRSVIAENNGGQGISGEGRIADCIAFDNATNGITFTGLIEDCLAIENGFDGIEFRGSSLVRNCRAEGNSADGFNQPTSSTSAGAVVEGCIAQGNVNNGFTLHQDSTVRNSTAFENGAAGIAAGNNRNTIEDNTSLDNAVGLEITGTDCDVRNNTVRGNADNYDFAPGNRLNLLLCQIPESLDWPCAVTLAGSLTGVTGQNGITIDSDNVLIDLAGHTLTGVPGAGSAIILANDWNNVTVRDGVVDSWNDGIRLVFSVANAGGHRVIGCTVSNIDNDGINVADRSLVKDCVVRSVGLLGIETRSDSTVSNCSVSDSITAGIGTRVNCRVEQCVITDTAIYGISTGSNSKVVDNVITGIIEGILLFENNTELVGNTISNCSVNGISATAAGSRIDGNTIFGCGTGILTAAQDVVVVRNTVSACGVNYDLLGGTIAGAIISSPATAGPWDNISF